MLPLEEVARRRLARALVSLEGAIAQFQAHGDQDAEPTVKRLKRLCEDIRTVLVLAGREPSKLG
jgi:hypothetical protein